MKEKEEISFKVYDYDGNITEEMSYEEWLKRSHAGGRIWLLHRASIVLELLLASLVFTLTLDSYEVRQIWILISFLINGVVIYVLSKCLVNDYERKSDIDDSREVFRYLGRKVNYLPAIKCLIIIVLCNAGILFQVFDNTLKYDEFKSATEVEQKTDNVMIDIEVNEIASTDSKKFEYRLCSDSKECNSYITDKYVKADKYEVKKITSTLDYPELTNYATFEKADQEIISYELLFLDEKPTVDTFSSMKDIYEDAYSHYKFDRLLIVVNSALMFLFSLIALEEMIRIRRKQIRKDNRKLDKRKDDK
ncbi:hypothetical protein WKT02_08815 [Erysipelotrichaceae bacterium HCN-30851]